jgi:formylglycine-generating enzyme required for sulfatase activity
MKKKNLFLLLGAIFLLSGCSVKKNSITTQTNRMIKANGVELKMIKVNGGTFEMGAAKNQKTYAKEIESPVHKVKLNDYYIAETEVTQDLWVAVMGSNPSFLKKDNHPVEQVSWEDCVTFIEKLNQITGEKFRLPTEAEWEYAARGGHKSNGYVYAGSNDLDEVAWTERNSNGSTHKVKTKKPNELGLYDMNGNVWEWCYDWYAPYEAKETANPSGPANGEVKINRGGGWTRAHRCWTSYRGRDNLKLRDYNLGFRLVLE